MNYTQKKVEWIQKKIDRTQQSFVLLQIKQDCVGYDSCENCTYIINVEVLKFWGPFLGQPLYSSSIKGGTKRELWPQMKG